MPRGQDLSRYQEKIVGRYYDHKDTIVAARLSEIVSDLCVAEADETAAGKKKVGSLWKRAATALKQTKLEVGSWEGIVERRDVRGLAGLVNRLVG